MLLKALSDVLAACTELGVQRKSTHSALMLLAAGEVPLCQLNGRRWSACTLHDPRLAAGRYCDAGVTSCPRRTEFIELWDRQAVTAACYYTRAQNREHRPQDHPLFDEQAAALLACILQLGPSHTPARAWPRSVLMPSCHADATQADVMCTRHAYTVLQSLRRRWSCCYQSATQPVGLGSCLPAWIRCLSTAAVHLQAYQSVPIRCGGKPEEVQFDGLQRLHLHAGLLTMQAAPALPLALRLSSPWSKYCTPDDTTACLCIILLRLCNLEV